ncbi:DNA glycosylase AlkZ-like family protein [Candidatus Xianfuyuplasma coldseepsis]|uniref:Winged helix-turn-helix domain-containing protein n=1 Tax=Candidatus Xianfuyuplasma coldseepsis TaxID=2782163 RepID=A0A7L7KSA6_9MOLU|nr:crosslink repair DNA glycosylase YcaQ family protein [Xianfuyuplasma coldseepsis]QMS84668.1 winged helix-turn-helix domain-containing protein [Xianfuyuplasma coldseepsis]
MIQWTKDEAQQYVINYHNINTPDSFTLQGVFERLQCIQFDPLNVVGTNPELVLQSRIQGFTKNQLSDALYQDRYLVDGWEKQMCIYESKYIPHFTRVRDYRARQNAKGLQKYFDFDVHQITDEVYHIIQQNGPILSKDIHLGDHISYYWSKTKTSTVAIDHLFHQGKIGVHSRKNTQKRYQVMEQIYPNIIEEDPFNSEEEATDFYLLRRIQSSGIIRNKSGYHLSGLYIKNKSKRTASLKRLLQKNKIIEVHIEGLKDIFYIPKDALDIPIKLHDSIAFIAPLDNLIWDRSIILDLFDFDYIWEVYTPKAKRKWGYYVLPIIRGHRFIGRIEFNKYKSNKPLSILSIQWEEGIEVTNDLTQLLGEALQRFATYLGASSIDYPKEVLSP